MSPALPMAADMVPVSVDVSPADVEFIGEGAANIVMSYCGQAKELIGCALRFRKSDSSKLQADFNYTKNVIEPIFGAEFLECGHLVSLPASCVRDIDEAIFKFRPAKRQSKRLNSSAECSDGRIVALKLDNLTRPPIIDARVLTVELKTKCGLLERCGLPSRFQLLQCWKKRVGQIARISKYDPVKMLSKKDSSVREAFLNALEEPQNNVQLFLDGKLVFSEAFCSNAEAGGAGGASPSKSWEDNLRDLGLSGRDGLADLISDILASPDCFLPERMKRAQAWAAGETAHLVSQLYAVLCERFGSQADDMLSRPESFQLALEGLEQYPCDESGIDLATEQLDALLCSVHTQPWSEDLQRNLVQWCCRFLIGRCAHDCSIMVNIAFCKPSSMTDESAMLLSALRYRQFSKASRAGAWYRLTVVDVDRKSSQKIPEYATQLDKYAQAYYHRFSASSAWDSGEVFPAATSADEAKPGACRDEALGGHPGAIIFRGDLVWKRDQGGPRGVKEFAFLRWALDDRDCARLVPSLAGYCTMAGERYIGMSNHLHGLHDPAVADIKMGTRTWGPDADAEKVRSQSEKAKNRTTGSLGLFVVAAKFRGGRDIGDFERVGGMGGRELKNEAEVADFLCAFLHTSALRDSALSRLQDIAAWWKQQEKYAFYASSLLLAYDTQKNTECKITMIDFTHAEQISEKSQDLSGYDVGLDNLLRIITGLAP
mmetsp:Transcript_118416/g.379657  ORF Transcript_118416/g.379657 Transcript_118416/m.379657 type:complete len:714 (+) Transcript_118416:1970-4111(+)